FMCVAVATPPQVVTITFHRTYGALGSAVTGTGGAVITASPTSTAGIYVTSTAAMSGTFRLAFQGATTPPLNSQMAAMDLRVALESLSTIQTVAVSKAMSYQPLTGRVDVTQGQLFVTCSVGDTCNFMTQRYGIPNTPLYIGGTWYTVLSDLISPDMPSTQLYLGDMNNNPIGYQGPSATFVNAYEWPRGYVWTVDLLLLAPGTSLDMLRPRQVNLSPAIDGTIVVQGNSCNQCYYVPDQTTAPALTMGGQYYLRADADNINGPSAFTPVVLATPRKIPDAPNAINVVVVSGTQVQVFFSPPSLAPTNVAPNYNSDITAYIVQWDTATTFLHGISACQACATAFTGTAISTSSDLSTIFAPGNVVTLGNLNCQLTLVAPLTPTTLTVQAGSGCAPFLNQAFDVVYYTFPPITVSGLPIQGTPPYNYLIQGLTIATKYYVRISAVNSVPVQQTAVSGVPPNNRQWTFPIAVT
ncbi:hypothetical protein As57867_020517, partial [Aphanomyces stellatus]